MRYHTDEWITRYNNGFLTAFNPQTGEKMRWQRGDGSNYASTPELMDIKITDYCNIGCSFCYMDSTTTGKHASLETIGKVFELAEKSEVFEIAMGGGEPTQHPEFQDILEMAKNYSFNLNFTSKDYSWIEKHYKEWTSLFRAVAFSVMHPKDVQEIIDAFKSIKRTWGLSSKVNLHVVAGVTTQKNLEGILSLAKELNIRTTILGYKTTGRASHEIPVPYQDWMLDMLIDWVQHYPDSISFDTAFAQQHKEQLVNKGIEDITYHLEDGNFSGYIDCVEEKVGLSSYDNNQLSLERFTRSELEEKLQTLRVLREVKHGI